MTGRVTVACIQVSAGREVEPNIASVGTLVRRARDAGAEFILCSGSGHPGDHGGLSGKPGPGPDLRSEFSGVPARLWPGQLLRVQLYDAGSVRRIGIGPRRPVRYQPVFRES